MKQKIEYSSPEVISMEEYLAKRKRIREDVREKQKRNVLTGRQALVLAEMYIKRKIKRRTFYFGPSFMVSSSSSFVTRKAS